MSPFLATSGPSIGQEGPPERDALMRRAREGCEPFSLIALIQSGCDLMAQDAQGFRAIDHALVHARSAPDAALCERMFDALARAMIELPGGPSAIALAIERARPREASPLPPAVSLWAQALEAWRERDALLPPAPGSHSGPRPRL